MSERRGDVTTVLLDLGRALHEAGTPAHRIEDTVSAVAAGAGIQAQIFSTPTLLLCTFGSGESSKTLAQRVSPAEYNLGRMVEVDTELDAVAAGDISPEEALVRIDARRSERAYPAALTAFSHAVLSATVALLFGGNGVDVLAAAVISFCIGTASLVRWKTPHLLNVTAAFVASFAGYLANQWIGGSAATIALASLIVLVPGLTFTVGLIELATRHLTSGTTRIMAAVITFLELGVGGAVGRVLASTLGESQPVILPPLPSWLGPSVLPLSALGLLAVFNVPARRFWVLMLTTAIAFFGARLGAVLLGPLLGASVGAFAVAAAANVYARTFKEPSALALVPAILLLVPGSIGYRGLESFLAAQTDQAIDAMFSMLVVGTSIVTGVLAANAAVSPRRLL